MLNREYLARKQLRAGHQLAASSNFFFKLIWKHLIIHIGPWNSLVGMNVLIDMDFFILSKYFEALDGTERNGHKSLAQTVQFKIVHT